MLGSHAPTLASLLVLRRGRRLSLRHLERVESVRRAGGGAAAARNGANGGLIAVHLEVLVAVVVEQTDQ